MTSSSSARSTSRAPASRTPRACSRSATPGSPTGWLTSSIRCGIDTPQLEPRAKARHDLLHPIGELRLGDVLVGEHPLRLRIGAHPLDEAAPEGGVLEDDGMLHGLAGLDQNQDLEELVQRAEAPREAD